MVYDKTIAVKAEKRNGPGPGVVPARASENINTRRAGTKVSCTSMSLLPVPARPQTNQVSMISQSSIGSRKNEKPSKGS